MPNLSKSLRLTINIGLPCLLLSLGIVSRLLPLFSEARIYSQFPIDDGYYMLTIARNLALGLGMSIANGEIPTNGTQPLMTFVWALFYWLVDGDKLNGIIIVHIFQALCACASAYLIYQLANRLLPKSVWRQTASLWVAALWFSSQESLVHTMTCLETGPLVLAILIFFWLYLHVISTPLTRQSYRQWVGLGACLGIIFWIRNDTAFLAIVVAVSRLTLSIGKNTQEKKQLFFQAFLIGSTSGLMALPWMIFNYTSFGHITPISGIAEAGMRTNAFDQMRLSIIFMASSVYMIMPKFPSNFWQQYLAFPIIASLAPILFAFSQRQRQKWPEEWIGISRVWLPYTAMLFCFYAIFFGVWWMITRYFFPITPFMGILIGGILGTLWESSTLIQKTKLYPLCAVFLVLSTAYYHNEEFITGRYNAHFVISKWAKNNVKEDTWVAAWQSGMLGYFHDRTINLDGKVNPLALNAYRDKGIGEYAQSTKAEYIIDWRSIALNKDFKYIPDYFTVIEDDPQSNLAVLQRIRLNTPEKALAP